METLWEASFPFVSGRCHLYRSMPFQTTVVCPFHEEDKVLIVEIEQILTVTLTLTLTETKIDSKICMKAAIHS